MDKIQKIRQEIERRLEKYDPNYTSAGSELKKLISFINSLQQEQLEVDLEKEIDKTVSECTNGYNFDWDKFACHFYELGRTEGIKGNLEETPSNVDLEKFIEKAKRVLYSSNPDDYIKLVKELAELGKNGGSK